MLGYKTWVDKNKLLGGEIQWNDIQEQLKNHTIKLLLVYSRNILDEKGNLRSGIAKELGFAESIASNEKLEDFIIPLKIDSDAPYNQFIGSNIIMHIDFCENWADGLTSLQKKLEKSNIPKQDSLNDRLLANWCQDKFFSDCSIIKKKEILYSSWWKINDCPGDCYLYEFQNDSVASKVVELNNDIPIACITNYITTFEKDLKLEHSDEIGLNKIIIKKVYKFSIADLYSKENTTSFPSRLDYRNHFTNLMSAIIDRFFKSNGLLIYELSNGKAYYLPKIDNFKRIPFRLHRHPKIKHKALGGIFYDKYWHYAVSVKFLLSPFFCFSLKSHIIFTSDGFAPIADKDIQHSYRRRKGKAYFNDDWRNFLLVFIQRLRDDNNEIKVKLSSDDQKMTFKDFPIMFITEYGYHEPKKTMDMNSVEDYIDDDILDEETLVFCPKQIWQ
jgi:hypothetical protein